MGNRGGAPSRMRAILSALPKRVRILIISIGMAAIVIPTAASVFADGYRHSATLVIPKSSYVNGQEPSVAQALVDKGFTDPEISDDAVRAKGTPKRVRSYLDSYYQRYVKPMRDYADGTEIGDSGIESVNVSSDYKTITIVTYSFIGSDDTATKLSLVDSDVDRMITTFATWYGMNNDGAMPTVQLMRDDDKEPYYKEKATSASKVLRDWMEGQDLAAASGNGEGANNEDAGHDEGTDDVDTEKGISGGAGDGVGVEKREG